MLLEQAEMQGKFDTEIKDARKRHETQHEEMQKKYDRNKPKNQWYHQTKINWLFS